MKHSKGYFAVAHVQEIIADPSESDMYLAIITPNSYLDFGNQVEFKSNGSLIEKGLYNDLGRIFGSSTGCCKRNI